MWYLIFLLLIVFYDFTKYESFSLYFHPTILKTITFFLGNFVCVYVFIRRIYFELDKLCFFKERRFLFSVSFFFLLCKNCLLTNKLFVVLLYSYIHNAMKSIYKAVFIEKYCEILIGKKLFLKKWKETILYLIN